MNKIKWVLELLFKALGLHDGTKKLLLVFIILTVIQLPYSIPGLWKTGWSIYFAWKYNVPPSSLTSRPAPSGNVGTSEDMVPRTGPTAPKPTRTAHRSNP